ncbi:hypothetical protein SAMN05421819_3930 [Bryocella elongata]|uniref:Glycosyl hydrolase family 79, N-terminal domain n=2 Tax=Bryocella elongata TaxID=863522 RepID=A0A1H6BQE6_9BACT|nr:hypothetical protein SAMN05421819_3930 [Bryocella elongata]
MYPCGDMSPRSPLDRRRFVSLSLAATASAAASPWTALAQSATRATLVLHPDQPGPSVPANFLGLSYETQQLSDPTFFSPANKGLIAQLRALAPHGVLRLGGNTSDYGYWKPTPDSKMPPRKPREYKVGDPDPNTAYAVTPEAVHNLNAFLDATGWTCLYGINLGTNIPSLAAEEAAFVTKTLGPKLEYLQIGNEADRFGSTIRDPQTWGVDAFLAEWLTFAKAILAKVPNAMFGMPDIASNATWFATIGEKLKDDPIRAHIACLSHHYYIGGPPSNPEMTIDKILRPNPTVLKQAEMTSAAAKKLDTHWRMTEGNTCYRGGKPGVSDVFASALWSADYLLQLASLGYAGVNLHGGDGQMVANSLGGKLPGDELVLAAHGNPAEHPHPYYTPIAHIGDKYVAEPVSVGMRFAGIFAGAQLFALDFDPGPVNATAYAGRLANGQHAVAIINKDRTQPLAIDLARYSLGFTLTAPALDSRSAELGEPSRFREVSIVPPSSAIILYSTQG